MEPRTPAEWKTLFESEAFARQTEYYGPLGVEYTPPGHTCVCGLPRQNRQQ